MTASVAPDVPPPDSFLGQARGPENRLEIELTTGEVIRLRGQGAGRWPTTVSVIGDLHEVTRLIEGTCSRFAVRGQSFRDDRVLCKIDEVCRNIHLVRRDSTTRVIAFGLRTLRYPDEVRCLLRDQPSEWAREENSISWTLRSRASDCAWDPWIGSDGLSPTIWCFTSALGRP